MRPIQLNEKVIMKLTMMLRSVDSLSECTDLAVFLRPIPGMESAEPLNILVYDGGLRE